LSSVVASGALIGTVSGAGIIGERPKMREMSSGDLPLAFLTYEVVDVAPAWRIVGTVSGSTVR
jgi:hypothetical protein